MARCVLVLGRTMLQVYDLDASEVSIGRDVGQDIRIDNDTVSRRHAMLQRADDGWSIQDLGTSNGTRLNGRPVAFSRIDSGDVLQIGKYSILFEPSEAQVQRLERGQRSLGQAQAAPSTLFLDTEEIESLARRTQEVQTAHLQLTSAKRERRYPLSKDETLLGRSVEADVVIKGWFVGAFQAAIERDRGGYKLRALSRLRATKVNGERVSERRLQNRDEIVIGPNRLQFFDDVK